MLEGTYFEEYEVCTGEHCHQRNNCARWIYNVDMESDDLKNCYINFNKQHWSNYRCPYFLQYPNQDYPVARPNQYAEYGKPTPLPEEDYPDLETYYRNLTNEEILNMLGDD